MKEYYIEEDLSRIVEGRPEKTFKVVTDEFNENYSYFRGSLTECNLWIELKTQGILR